MKKYDTEKQIGQKGSQKKIVKNLATNENGNTIPKFLEYSKHNSKIFITINAQ